ncbi:MAG: cupin domain-containing protein [Solirubrobacterales bacterium]|nr:cupin domain-containing protein [Solirubrobacterales bacterium]
MPAQPTLLTAATDLATDTTSELFRAADRGVGVSFFINHTRPGAEVAPHRHPYPEVFVVQAGKTVFTVEGDELSAVVGQVVVVPAGTAHGFRNATGAVVEMLSIHPVAQMETEWLEES